MNRTRLAQALNTIAVGFAEAAEAMTETIADRIDTARDNIERGFENSQASLADVSVTFHEGSLESCPRHHKEYRSGKVTKPNPSGKFCATKADDAWSYNGWCSINPSNAAEYLRQAAG